ncbi:hypothetical protein [Sediminimonas qiaohouensis]|uniref:hypothetical protein n=1 Tax=Sediminimonas qiaohouensis TaxID=552061 RepID=UPI00041DC849|nr:hypothetical protein [Sediminimonas qiaohouensis]
MLTPTPPTPEDLASATRLVSNPRASTPPAARARAWAMLKAARGQRTDYAAPIFRTPDAAPWHPDPDMRRVFDGFHCDRISARIADRVREIAQRKGYQLRPDPNGGAA